MSIKRYCLLQLFLYLCLSVEVQAVPRYSWLRTETIRSLNDINAPIGAERIPIEKGSFAEWLRYLPLKAPDSPVLLYNGERKGNQSAHYSVVDLDAGSRDLQQCADVLIRLRSEYLFSRGKYSEISFSYTSGDQIPFQKWLRGGRPVVSRNTVVWKSGNPSGISRSSLMAYLTNLFMYAGSISLYRDTIKEAGVIQPGQNFVQAGSPGHAVLILDVAVDSRKKRYFLLGQSYMPAQDFHVLRNPASSDLSPWYTSEDPQQTPEWTFKAADRRRFR